MTINTYKFNEDTRVKIPTIMHLMRLGYQYLSLKGQLWDLDTNIFPKLFKTAIGKINPGIENAEAGRLLEDVKLLLDNEDLGKAFVERLSERSFSKELDSKENKERFFAGFLKESAKAKDKMAIYSLFLQHIIASLKPSGKAAVVVPTGFITEQSGIDKKIREHLVKNKMLEGVVSMPSNIFATTGTNVYILFIDSSNKGDVVLVDASSLGEKVKDGKNQKTVLTA